MRAAAVLLCCLPLSATAGEWLHVRARTRIDVQIIERTARGLRVRGALDPLSEAPIAGRTVAIAVEGVPGFYRYAEPSRGDGTFDWDFPLPAGRYTVRVTSSGDAEYGAAPPVQRPVELSRMREAARVEPDLPPAPAGVVSFWVYAASPSVSLLVILLLAAWHRSKALPKAHIPAALQVGTLKTGPRTTAFRPLSPLLRDSIFSIYRWAAVSLLPEPSRIEVATPRELLPEIASRTKLHDDLRALTTLVERACYGRNLPATESLIEAQRLAHRIAGD